MTCDVLIDAHVFGSLYHIGRICQLLQRRPSLLRGPRHAPKLVAIRLGPDGVHEHRVPAGRGHPHPLAWLLWVQLADRACQGVVAAVVEHNREHPVARSFGHSLDIGGSSESLGGAGNLVEAPSLLREVIQGERIGELAASPCPLLGLER